MQAAKWNDFGVSRGAGQMFPNATREQDSPWNILLLTEFGKDAKYDQSPIPVWRIISGNILFLKPWHCRGPGRRRRWEYLVLGPRSCGSNPGPGAQSPPAGWKARPCGPGRTQHALPCCHTQESRPTAPPHKRRESSNLQGQNSRANTNITKQISVAIIRREETVIKVTHLWLTVAWIKEASESDGSNGRAVDFFPLHYYYQTAAELPQEAIEALRF